MTTKTQYNPQAEEEKFRYSKHNILRSEKIYGDGFQSLVNIAKVQSLCEKLHMRPNMDILEIGSGLGGATFYLAQQYQANILGFDLSITMVELSTERLQQLNLSNVAFQHADITTAELNANAFDLVWTVDCFMYISDKQAVWNKFYKTLRPKGKLLMVDYCGNADDSSDEFKTYTETCGYYMQDIPSYAHSLKAAGFTDVIAEDITPELVLGFKATKDRLLKNATDFLQFFNQDELDRLVGRWDKKLQFCQEGHLKWGLFIASTEA